MGTADRASDAPVPDIRGNAGEVERVRALGGEYGLPRAAACAVTQRFQAYCTQVLPHEKDETEGQLLMHILRGDKLVASYEQKVEKN